MDYIKITIKKHTNPTKDQLGYTFLVVIFAITYNFFWSLIWLFRPLIPGLSPKQNFEIIVTTTSPVDTTLKL